MRTLQIALALLAAAALAACEPRPPKPKTSQEAATYVRHMAQT